MFPECCRAHCNCCPFSANHFFLGVKGIVCSCTWRDQLSIGIRLSIDGFTLAFERWKLSNLVTFFIMLNIIFSLEHLCKTDCLGYSTVMPFVSMACTSMCIGGPLALNRAQILSTQGAKLLGPVFAFHVAAVALGYWISKFPIFRTIALCTGIQSSTLVGLLATQFLIGSIQAVPSACLVVAMAIMGLCLAAFWGSKYPIRDLLPSSLLIRHEPFRLSEQING